MRSVRDAIRFMTDTPPSNPPATLPPLPPELAALGMALRHEGEGDKPFLARLYVSTRWEELALSGWSDEQKAAFLLQQFGFQDLHYTRYYPGAVRAILLDREEPVGRLYLSGMADELRIVDVSILPSHRGRGIGTALLRTVFEQGRERRQPVTIHVEVFNTGARRLYDRLGFVEVGGDGVHRKMAWRPD